LRHGGSRLAHRARGEPVQTGTPYQEVFHVHGHFMTDGELDLCREQGRIPRERLGECGAFANRPQNLSPAAAVSPSDPFGDWRRNAVILPGLVRGLADEILKG